MIDFNEVDIRIYLPSKVIFIGHKGRLILMSTEIDVNNCLYDFSAIYVKLYFHFYNKICIAKDILTSFNNYF